MLNILHGLFQSGAVIRVVSLSLSHHSPGHGFEVVSTRLGERLVLIYPFLNTLLMWEPLALSVLIFHSA